MEGKQPDSRALCGQACQANGMNQTVSSLGTAGAVTPLMILQQIEGWETHQRWHRAKPGQQYQVWWPNCNKRVVGSYGGVGGMLVRSHSRRLGSQ